MTKTEQKMPPQMPMQPLQGYQYPPEHFEVPPQEAAQPQYYNDADENEPLNTNTIVAQYKTETRVKSKFKFNLQNAIVFIDGVHYFIKELKAQFEY